MLGLLSVSPLAFLLVAAGLVIAITVHEFAHAWAANRLGDPTPSLQGRLTLNPLAHLDPLGTILLFVAGFGWGKPVVFDPYNLENPRRDAALISLAGPASNLTLAVLISLLLHAGDLNPVIHIMLAQLVRLNIVLAIFNLIPIHPLDGGKILVGFLPKDMALEAEDLLRRYGMLILLLLILPLTGTSPVHALLTPVINTLTSLLLP